MHLITLVNYYCTCWGFAIDQLVLEYLLHRCVTLIKQMWLHRYQFLFGFKAQNLKVTQLAELGGAVLVPRSSVRGSLLREHWVPATCVGSFSHKRFFCWCVSAMSELKKQANKPARIFLIFCFVLLYIESQVTVLREPMRKTNLKVLLSYSGNYLRLVLG